MATLTDCIAAAWLPAPPPGDNIGEAPGPPGPPAGDLGKPGGVAGPGPPAGAPVGGGIGEGDSIPIGIGRYS